MKKDLGLVQAVYPMPVLMVAAYDEKEKVNVMNVAWGQICDEDKIILFIGKGKRTWLNIQASKAFTVSLADRAHMDVADFSASPPATAWTTSLSAPAITRSRATRSTRPSSRSSPW